jgi:hypothetical protein
MTPSNSDTRPDEGVGGALSAAHDALNRMRRAHERGTGCHLTAEMVASLGLSFLGETWSDDDPRGEA